MELLVVTAARMVNGKLDALKVGRYHMGTHVWISEPAERRIPSVVSELQTGKRAFVMFEKNGKKQPGPELDVVNDGSGQLTVAPMATSAGLMLEDLPPF